MNFVSGEDAAKKVVTAIEAEGSKAIAVKADVSKEAEVRLIAVMAGLATVIVALSSPLAAAKQR